MPSSHSDRIWSVFSSALGIALVLSQAGCLTMREARLATLTRTAEPEAAKSAGPSAALARPSVSAVAPIALVPAKSSFGSALALTMQFTVWSGDQFANGCDFRLSEVGTKNVWQVRLNPKMTSVVIEIPPGTYAPTELLCSATSDFDLSNWHDRFTVHAGKINYAGHVEIAMAAGQPPVFGLKIGTNEERAGLGALFKNASSDARATFVSSWTGKAITTEIVHQRPYSGLEYTWKSAVKMGEHAALIEELRGCEATEIGQNRVLLGRLKLTAFYLKGRVASTILDDLPNTFSDVFIDCLRSGLMTFSAQSSEPFSITIDI
jgi:hypothetical protein